MEHPHGELSSRLSTGSAGANKPVLSDMTNVTSPAAGMKSAGSVSHAGNILPASLASPGSLGQKADAASEASSPASKHIAWPPRGGLLPNRHDLFSDNMSPARVEHYKKRREELLEFHRRQLAELAVQQQTMQHQQSVCEQLTDLIADQESVLHEHAFGKAKKPSAAVSMTSNLSSICVELCSIH